MNSKEQSKPGNQKLVAVMPLFGPGGFLDWDYEHGSPVYLGGKVRPLPRQDIFNILMQNQNNPEHFPRDPSKCPDVDCIMCGREKSKVWITSIMCEECYTYWVDIMHNCGDTLSLPTYFQEAGRRHRHIRGKNLFIHFRPDPHTQPKMTAYRYDQRIYLGIKNMYPVLMVGRDIIQFDARRDFVEIYRAFTARGYVSKIDVYIHEPIELNGKILEGSFNNCALLGKTICDRAYLGECLSLQGQAAQWPGPDEDLKDHNVIVVDRPYPENRLNEMIAPAGVTGITQMRPQNLKIGDGNQSASCVFPGDYCPRCSDEIFLKNRIKSAKKAHIHNEQKIQDIAKVEKNTDELTAKLTDLPAPVVKETERIARNTVVYSDEKTHPEGTKPASSTSTYVTKHVKTPTKAIPDTITVPKAHYTDLLTQIEKLKLKNKRMNITMKSLKSDLATTSKMLNKAPPMVQDVHETVVSEESI